MAHYWHYKPEVEEKAKAFFDSSLEPEMTLDFEIGEKDFVSSGQASSQIKMFLKKLGVGPDILRRVAIASYEAEINIAAHSKGGKIISNIFNDLVHITFKDKGPGLKDIEQALVPGYSTATELVREMGFGAGLGLPNIKKNSDVLHIESEENSSTLLEILIYFEL